MYKYVVGIIFYVLLFPALTHAAVLRVAPGSNKFSEGDTIRIQIIVDSSGKSINAVSGTVSFPQNILKPVSIDTSGVVDFWTSKPAFQNDRISFEGVMLNPGYTGNKGVVFTAVFQAQTAGNAQLRLNNASVLANDGQGTNVLASLANASLTVSKKVPMQTIVTTVDEPSSLPHVSSTVVLPVITDYTQAVKPKESITVRGKGEPLGVTEIDFKLASEKSLGERFVQSLQNKKHRLRDVYLTNDAEGNFEYVSPNNLVAGAYRVTPYHVDAATRKETPGAGTQVLVNDNKIVKAVVVILNVMALFVPIVALAVIIYFIPWYSFRRMRVLRKKLVVEEEKIELAEKEMLKK